MNAPVLTGAESFLARYTASRDRLPGDRAVRDAAAEAFRRSGLPGRRIEAWKYTDLRPIAATAFQSPVDRHADCAALLARAPAIDAPRLVFVDGGFRADLSTPPTGAQVARFADHPQFHARATEPLVALNTMLAEDGAIIDVPAGKDAGIVHLVSIARGEADGATDFYPRHVIRLERDAKLTLLETALGDGAYLHSPVIEIDVAAGATLNHIRLQDESRAAFHLATLFARVAEHATYDSFALTVGGRMARTEVHAHLAGPHATVHLNAAQLLAGTQHADFTTVVRHDAPHGASRQTVKNVLAGRSRGVFQGRIEVARAAQKTDGFQLSQALLLSPEAEIDTKPELEIFADDVKCSHGATVGELDADQLFYLKSRGIPDAEARSMLVRAFLAESLDMIANGAVRTAFGATVERWWERQAA